MGFGFGLKQVSSINKAKDEWKSKAECDKAGEGSKTWDEQEEDNKKTQKSITMSKQNKHTHKHTHTYTHSRSVYVQTGSIVVSVQGYFPLCR